MVKPKVDFDQAANQASSKKTDSLDMKALKKRIKELEEQLAQQKQQDLSFVKLSTLKRAPNVRGNKKIEYKYEDLSGLAEDMERNGHHTPVLISADGYIILGFRRVGANELLLQQGKINDEILAYRYHKNYKEITEDELLDLQLSENEQRRSLDNFQLSKLYNDKIDKGWDQKQLAKKFKKSKSVISKTVSISKIHPELVKYLKQFQVFGWSESKYKNFNFEENGSDKILNDIEKKKGIIGIIPLVAISKHEAQDMQAKVFLDKFGARLDEKDLEDPIFQDIDRTKEEQSFSEKSIKQLDSFSNYLKNQAGEFKDSKDFDLVTEKVNELRELILKSIS